MGFVYMYAFTQCIRQYILKRVSDISPETRLQTVVSFHVGAGSFGIESHSVLPLENLFSSLYYSFLFNKKLRASVD